MATYPRVEILDQGPTAVLLRVTTAYGYPHWCRHFLVGQDSNNPADPFVTQVFKAITTVPEAFDSLVPKVVREAMARALNVKRQGDWFFIPSAAPQGPSCEPDLKKRVEFPPRSGEPGPVFDPKVLYDGWEPTRHRVRDFGDIRGCIVYRANSRHYVKGVVVAPDHPWCPLEDWHMAVRRRFGPWGKNGRARGD